MASINKVILIGHIGQPPDIRLLPSGKKVCTISLATSRTFKNEQNQKVEETTWHRVTFFGRVAEIIEQYTGTGSQIYVEGRIKNDKWEDQNGQTRYSTQIIGETLQLLGSNTRR